MTFCTLTNVNSDFPTDQTFHQFHDLDTELDLHRIMSGFHGTFAMGVASHQGMLNLLDTWFRYCIVAFSPSQIPPPPRKTGYIVAFPPENWLYSSFSPGEILLYSQISPFFIVGFPPPYIVAFPPIARFPP